MTPGRAALAEAAATEAERIDAAQHESALVYGRICPGKRPTTVGQRCDRLLAVLASQGAPVAVLDDHRAQPLTLRAQTRTLVEQAIARTGDAEAAATETGVDVATVRCVWEAMTA